MQRYTTHPVILAVCILLLACGVAQAETTVEGKILDAAGDPVSGYRVVARMVEGTEPFISQPSDEEGRYSVVVPTGKHYLIVALIAPSGSRIALPDSDPVTATQGRVTLDLQMSHVAPRIGRGALRGADRLFLSFVEDPAITARQHLEIQLDTQWDGLEPDRSSAHLIGAFAFPRLPQLEIGLRAGFGEIRPSGASNNTGALDTDVWAKFLVQHSERWETVVGTLITLPTGDADEGLGRDSTQAELFVAGSCSLEPSVLIGHVGVVTSADGEVFGEPREGGTTVSAGVGVLVPLSSDASLVFEARYDGERLQGTDSDSLLLVGLDWKVHWRGKLRTALAAGLEGSSVDGRFLVGYAFSL